MDETSLEWIISYYKGCRVFCKNCKIILVESLTTQHRQMVLDMCGYNKTRHNFGRFPKNKMVEFKWRKL